MGFPTTPLSRVVEIAPGADLTAASSTWAWTDITSYVRHSDAITVTRGSADEALTLQANSCRLTLDNTGGRFVTRNPTGTWYGSLRRGTPLRVSVDPETFTISDGFGRSVSSGWGTSDSGHVWSTAGGSASDFSVGSGAGKHSTGTTNVNRFATIGSSLTTWDETISFSTDKLASGAAIDVAIVGRYAGTGDYYALTARLNTDQTVTGRISSFTGGAETLLTSGAVSGLTHATNTQITLRAQGTAQGLRLKIWSTSSAEPSTWNLTVAGTLAKAAGAVGVKTIRNTGNTSGVTVVSFDDLTVTDGPVVRFTGQVFEWPTRWDISGRNKYVPIVANGPVRRLRQGQVLRSALYRALSGDSAVVAYWPMEDESGATSFGSAVSGGLPMTYFTVTPASDSQVDGSAALPVVGSFGYCYATMPTYSTATAWAVRFVMRLPSTPSTETPLIGWDTAGTVARWTLNLTPGGTDQWTLKGYSAAGTELLGAAGVNLGKFYAEAFFVAINATQNGGNIDWDFTVFHESSTSGGGSSGSVAGTIGTVKAIYHTTWPGLTAGGHTIGHVAVADDTSYISTAGASAAVGWAGETSTTRFARLCGEGNIDCTIDITGSDILATLGPQQRTKLLDLLNQVGDAEEGLLYEDTLGRLVLRTHSRRYGRSVDLSLDHAQHHLAPQLEPADDDQKLRNDIEVSRITGGKSRYTSTESGFTEADIGAYSDSASLNLQYDADLPYHAQWRVHLGTVAELRYPQLSLELARSPSLVSSWLACDIGFRVQVSNPPAELPPDPIDVHIDGYSETLGHRTWSVVLNCSPARPWDVFTVEDSTLGRLDTAGSTLASGVTSSGTSLSVATSTGPLWTTSSGDRPFDIEVAGERMTVTNLTGSSSPQTFTVTRSVNGVSKAQSAGAVVQLWHPGVNAL